MNRTKKLAVILALAAIPAAQAARYIGFETEAYLRAIPASSQQSMVFSPMAFELDCVLFAEAVNNIAKAKMAETMGIVTDFDMVYTPIFAAFNSETRGCSFHTARGFLVDDAAGATPAYRKLVQDKYNAMVCTMRNRAGAEAWFRAMMDATMEDFTIPNDALSDKAYCYYDLVSATFQWTEPFRASDVAKKPFQLANGQTCEIPFLTGERLADTWDGQSFTMLRLEMANDCAFYALLPKEGTALSSIRSAVSAAAIDHLLTITQSVTENTVRHGRVRVTLPRLKIASRIDFAKILLANGFLTQGVVKAAGQQPAKELVQQLKFSIDDFATPPPVAAEVQSAEDARPIAEGVRDVTLDRPFLFFIHHLPTQTVPIAGQFTGI